ncbi:DUF4446 family protein [Nocardiopsis ansamitocini]|uniref:DUF4446 family protein n=1 Tax=Nocardiopsis ansamitocini TaxID=1670832 RepID=A0A9W6UKL6_9ACTN|nr:DUF4446 family protein [Nocardiopsis ansamitocini]GLU49862.1 hypothetical protein Nans01_42130 [Nocardiopsis ansamitocini]
MLSIILTLIALLLAAGALALGALAFLRTRTVVEDCRSVVQRMLPDTGGGIDVRSIRDVGIVRYDALEEMSGARSFSLAMLNTAGDGVVLTSINGRTETRTYAKIVEGGSATEALSPEEYRAIRAARLGQGPGGSMSAEPAEPVSSVSIASPREPVQDEEPARPSTENAQA